jgi:hypothetical protein
MPGCKLAGRFDHVDVTPTFAVSGTLPVLERLRETPSDQQQ